MAKRASLPSNETVNFLRLWLCSRSFETAESLYFRCNIRDCAPPIWDANDLGSARDWPIIGVVENRTHVAHKSFLAVGGGFVTIWKPEFSGNLAGPLI